MLKLFCDSKLLKSFCETKVAEIILWDKVSEVVKIILWNTFGKIILWNKAGETILWNQIAEIICEVKLLKSFCDTKIAEIITQKLLKSFWETKLLKSKLLLFSPKLLWSKLFSIPIASWLQFHCVCSECSLPFLKELSNPNLRDQSVEQVLLLLPRLGPVCICFVVKTNPVGYYTPDVYLQVNKLRS